MRLESAIHVEAAPDIVWTIATDPDLAPKWNPNVERIAGFSGMPISVGATWTQWVKILGHPVEMQARVTECDAPRRGVVRFTGMGEPVVTTTVAPDGAGSLLRQVMDITVPAGIAGMGLRLGGPLVEQQLQEALRRQKRAAEDQARAVDGSASGRSG